MSSPVVVLVHGAFADSSSWNEVIARLGEESVPALGVASPLQTLSGDADHLSDILDSIGESTILVGHSYGGMVITEAGHHDSVAALVYVAGFAPDQGESASSLAGVPGSALAEAMSGYPVRHGDTEWMIRQDAYAECFAADVPGFLAEAMSRTQRPIADVALTAALTADTPAWRVRPSWFVYGDEDRIVPPAGHRRMAERAEPRLHRVLRGGSHAVGVSQPDAVADVILHAVASVR